VGERIEEMGRLTQYFKGTSVTMRQLYDFLACSQLHMVCARHIPSTSVPNRPGSW